MVKSKYQLVKKLKRGKRFLKGQKVVKWAKKWSSGQKVVKVVKSGKKFFADLGYTHRIIH